MIPPGQEVSQRMSSYDEIRQHGQATNEPRKICFIDQTRVQRVIIEVQSVGYIQEQAPAQSPKHQIPYIYKDQARHELPSQPEVGHYCSYS